MCFKLHLRFETTLHTSLSFNWQIASTLFFSKQSVKEESTISFFEAVRFMGNMLLLVCQFCLLNNHEYDTVEASALYQSFIDVIGHYRQCFKWMSQNCLSKTLTSMWQTNLTSQDANWQIRFVPFRPGPAHSTATLKNTTAAVTTNSKREDNVTLKQVCNQRKLHTQ